jgi:hypothetical protein
MQAEVTGASPGDGTLPLALQVKNASPLPASSRWATCQSRQISLGASTRHVTILWLACSQGGWVGELVSGSARRTKCRLHKLEACVRLPLIGFVRRARKGFVGLLSACTQRSSIRPRSSSNLTTELTVESGHGIGRMTSALLYRRSPFLKKCLKRMACLTVPNLNLSQSLLISGDSVPIRPFSSITAFLRNTSLLAIR